MGVKEFFHYLSSIMKEIKRLSQSMHSSLRSATVLFDLPRIVEELVYNSLDASSTKVLVSVSVKACYVKVEDNGCGITRDGLVILGERYATSKIPNVADIASTMETLGFRGEALASLSNISLVEIRSKACGQPNAYCKIIKCSKCLFFGIDEQRQDVGTTVIVRDLFYNQPIRKKYMQSSIKKLLHSLKKCVLRIALVHPQVSFKLVEIDGEDNLLCTFPSPSSLPLVTAGFGKEISDSLREIVYSDEVLSLSGYISCPSDAFSTKAFQYIYINSRFICKGPIHILINRLATTFQSTMMKWMDNSKSNCRKKRKSHGFPAFLLNLCCPMSVYDLSFEPSKMIIEFKDWSIILSFIEQAILPFWKQLALHLFQGISGEGMLNGGRINSSRGHDINLPENFLLSQFFHALDSISCVTENDQQQTYQKQIRSSEDQADIFSLSKRCESKVDDFEVASCLFQQDGNSLQGSSAISCLRSNYLKRKRCSADDFSYSSLTDGYNSDCIPGKMPYENNPPEEIMEGEYGQTLGNNELYETVDEDFPFPLASHGSPRKTYISSSLLMENENVNSICSTSFWICKDLPFKTDIGNAQDETSFSGPIVGAIRKCQTSVAQNSSLNYKNSPFHKRPFRLWLNSLHHGRVEDVLADSNLGASLYFGSHDTLLSKTAPNLHIMHDSILEDGQFYKSAVGCGHYATDEKNAEVFSCFLNNCCEVQVDLTCTDNSLLNERVYSSPIYNEHSSVWSIPAKCSSTCQLDDRKDIIKPLNSRNMEILGNNLKTSTMKNYDDAIKSASKDTEPRSFCYSRVRKLRLSRSQSAPPFFKGKKRFPILNVLPVKAAGENSIVKSFHAPTGQLEDYSASQPGIKPSAELLPPCSRLFNNEKLPASKVIEMQNFEESVEGCGLDAFDPASVSLSKWRKTSNMQLQLTHDVFMSHNRLQCPDDILDISSGLLHLAGRSLVPESISKECLDDVTVLLQLDRKYIPVVARGSLVIIDQHAADERIRLEGLRKKVLNGELSSITYLDTENELILPEFVFQMLQKYFGQIKKWGWICNIQNQCPESFERNMNILRQQKCRTTLVAVPHILGIDLTDKDLLEYVEQLVETDGSSFIPPSIVRILNYKACRGAIMFGDALLPSECSLIVDELKATSLCFQCAHGRPTTVPLLHLPSLHEQLSKLGLEMDERSDQWHGLRRHRPSIDRARHRLELSKSSLHAS
ncbi:hypothetical protein HPP92_020057 [Vanilla planifolia]|uniref:DNA mismatch repair protein MLH3 n=1 Tax=Vanilla planifolia TaxID=51239 RepID=A0A835ULI6_VANPL|nr:hypothetical protein HPP92_020057 [Vanilla planifolia]